MADVARLRYVTEHYDNLQGLRLVPLGIAFLTFGTAQAAGLLQSEANRTAALVGITATTIAVLLSANLIGSYYRRRYGFVEARATTISLTWLALILVCVLTSRLPLRPTLPVLPIWPSAFLGGVVCLVRGIGHGGILHHYLAIAAGCFLLAGFELLGLSQSATNGSLQILTGIAVLVAGIGDHRVLRSALNPPKAADYGSTL
jgi:hypothetical protein